MGGYEVTANDTFQETKAVTTATISAASSLDLPLHTAAGDWHAVEGQSHASFVARVAGRPVRGRLPLAGEALIAGSVEHCATRLVAATGALTTASPILDRILTGPGFLEAETYPEISFQSQTMTRVPTGWRAIGHLRVKDVDYELACQLGIGQLSQHYGRRRFLDRKSVV